MEMFYLEIFTWLFKVEDLHKIAPYKIGLLVVILAILMINWRTHMRVKKVNFNHCNRAQARIVFKNLILLHQHQIEDFFFRTYELVKITKVKNTEALNNKYDEFFRSLQETGVDELSHFSAHGESIGVFLENCSIEYLNIKNHLIGITSEELEDDRKNASFYLKGKFSGINASFGNWLTKKLKIKTEVIE